MSSGLVAGACSGVFLLFLEGGASVVLAAVRLRLTEAVVGGCED